LEFSGGSGLLVSVEGTATSSETTTLSALSGSTFRDSLWLGLLECGGNNVLTKVKVLSEVFNSFVCEEVVVPLPAELFSDVASGSQRLGQLDDVQVRDIDESMLGSMEVLLSAKNSL